MVKKKANKRKKESYLKGVMSEAKKVSWPTRKEVLKFAIASVVFIVFISIFFLILTIFLSTIFEVVK